MSSLNPYLNFPGNTEEAFNFYKSIFGGQFAMVMRFKDTAEADKVPEAEKDKLMHIALPVGTSVLMGTDALESMGQTVQQGNNHHLSFDADSKEQADKTFIGLSQGGKIIVPMQDQFWGDYFGMVTDKFGIQWMISFNKGTRP